MVLENLKLLHKEMQKNNEVRIHYTITYNNIELDIIFFTDDKPFELLVGAIGTRESFIFKVEYGYKINTYLNGDEYRRLCNLLGIEYDPNNKFYPSSFFNSLDNQTPITLQNTGKPSTIKIGNYRKVHEEEDKLYFCGWFDNVKVGKHVRPKNLQKTLTLLGKDKYELCKRKNVSSCWSADPQKEILVELP